MEPRPSQRLKYPAIEFAQTETDGWHGRRDRELIKYFDIVNVIVRTGAMGFSVSLTDIWEGEKIDVENLRAAIAEYDAIQNEIDIWEMVQANGAEE